MAIDKSCPGSRTIREPIPELVNCPECGKEVEIWTDELKAKCRSCGASVFRAQQASCIDWCPHAKECVGPEIYERLKPGAIEVEDGDSPLAILEKEHERALEILGLLRGAGFCLKMSETNKETPLRERGLDHLNKVAGFFEEDLKLHFLREEEVLFPAVDKHIGKGTSPTKLLLQEHQQLWDYYDTLKCEIAKLQEGEGKDPDAAVSVILNTAATIEQFLKEHIRKEDVSLFPLARKLIPEDELSAIPGALKALSVSPAA